MRYDLRAQCTGIYTDAIDCPIHRHTPEQHPKVAMSEGKQEARERNLNEFEVCPKCLLSICACDPPLAARQANQPQEKAQPESQFDPLVHEVCCRCGHSCSSEFQRGQQAMAEKAAQLRITDAKAALSIMLRLVAPCLEPNPRKEWEEHIERLERILASAEPPQGEAEKEGRATGIDK